MTRIPRKAIRKTAERCVSTHTHDWMPEDDGTLRCGCGAIKKMTPADAAALWGWERSDKPMKTITLTLEEWETIHLQELADENAQCNGGNGDRAPNGRTWERATQDFAAKIKAALA